MGGARSSHAHCRDTADDHRKRARLSMTESRHPSAGTGQVQTGDRAPDFALQTLDGQSFSLSDTVRKGHKVLLVFLRHLG